MKNVNKILLVICIALVGVFLFYSATRSGKLTHGFASYYTFSKILVEGGDIGCAYDTTYFYQKLSGFGFGNIKDIANNPPGNSIMMLPAVWLEPLAAKKLWAVLSVAFLITALILLAGILGYPIKDNSAVIMVSCALIFYPLYNGIALGQAYALILMLFSISLYGLKNNKSWLVSLPLALIIFIKGYGIIPLIALLVMKKYREFFMTLLTVIVLILVTLPLFHIEVWQVYCNNIVSGFGSGIMFANTANQSLNGFVRHLFMFDPVLNPNAISALSQSAIAMMVYGTSLFIIALVWLAVTKIIYAAPKSESSPLGRAECGSEPLLIFTAAISLNVILAPVAEEYHYVLLLPLIYFSSKLLIENYKRTSPAFIIFLLLFIILAAPINYKSLHPYGFPLNLLAYPKLFAGLCMIFLAVFIGRSAKLSLLKRNP